MRGTPLARPRDENFPATIVRPSLTYDMQLPIAIGGWGCYTLCDRLKKGRPIIIHGDGSSLRVVTHAGRFSGQARSACSATRPRSATPSPRHRRVLTWNQIYQTIADAMNVEAKVVHIPSDFIVKVTPEMTGSLWGDKTWSVAHWDTKIKTWAPGFQAVIPFHQGIRRTLAWFNADPKRQRVDDAVNKEMDHILAAWEKQ